MPTTNEHDHTTVILPKSSRLTMEIVEQLDQLLNSSTAEEYRNTLLEVYHLYILHEHGHLPVHFDSMANHMYALTEFFRITEAEMRKKPDH
ncbi:hypothetical protein D4L85_23220 [Chryseolinea soli]|uniref:Uncharacterized protein n=2 Tax=Chryseolinea soli TaxID=2321403 RepID=A0A385ST47_9BACT|nr:hypothetical protein D4L85_23220 [Chryseolinea soli]